MNSVRHFLSVIIISVIACLAASAQEHPWQGKRVAWFGDSMTDPNHKAASQHCWDYLNDWLGTTSYVYSVSGRQWNDIPRQADKLEKEHGNDFDAIIIFIGTNDFNAGIPIGEWYEVKDTTVLAATHAEKGVVKRKMRTPSTDPSTVRGRINTALSKVKEMYPDKQIVLLTPLHRAFARFSDKNIQPSEAYQNKCGEWFDAYVDCVKEAGNIWALPVIDLNAISGLNPMVDSNSLYFKDAATDRLHANDEGHRRIARTLYYQLATLPCTF